MAITGSVATKRENAAVPITVAEQIESTHEAFAAGASLAHCHVRDDEGRHSLDVGRYREAIAAVRQKIGGTMLVQITTEAVGRYKPDEQMEVVRRLRPEAASVALSELVPDATDETEAAQFYHWAADEGVALQHILYAPEEASRLLNLAPVPRARCPASGSCEDRAKMVP